MKAIKNGDEIRIDDGYLHRESIKEIPGRRYDTGLKAWFAPCNEKNAALLQMLGAELDASLDAFVGPVCDSAAAEETPIVRMPIRAEPYKHQVRAFNFALKILCRNDKPLAACKGEDSEATQPAKEARGKGGDEKHDSKK